MQLNDAKGVAESDEGDVFLYLFSVHVLYRKNQKARHLRHQARGPVGGQQITRAKVVLHPELTRAAS